jgi:HSP20 family protein
MPFIRNLILVAVVSGVVWSGPAAAQPESDVNVLKSQVAALQKRVEELEATISQKPTLPQPPDTLHPMGGGDLLSRMRQMQDEADQMFHNALQSTDAFQKGVLSSNLLFDDERNIKDTGDSYEVSVDVKGMNPKDVQINVNNLTLTVRGNYTSDETQQAPGQYLKSSRVGNFLQMISLPPDADTSKMSSENKGDVLLITFPKKK